MHISKVRASHWSSESYMLYTYVTFVLPSQSNVAQWLEHLTGHQKVTGCTHM